jgi:pimeloyl-ACP methyl ester carboxylesterase
VIEKFGYGCSDLYEGPCDVDSVVAYQRRALENAGEKGPYILLPHSMSGLEAIRWKQKYPDEIGAIIGLDTSMKKILYIFITFVIMSIVSRFVVRIVDATVQIDNDIGMLLLLLALVNAVIGFAGYKLYQPSKKE